MNFFDLCIRRPVLATVLSLILVLLGTVSYTRLTVREYPNVDEPVVSVTTDYPGASAAIVESQITQILEGSIAGIAGIDVLESSSRQETSRITVRFRPDVNPDAAASDVRDRVSRVRGRLPLEVKEPVIAKVEADAQAIMYLVFTSDALTQLEISDYVDRFVVDRFKNVPGVADVVIYGERRYAMRIWINQERLAAYNLTVQDVEAALRAQNAEVPSGRIESHEREFSILSRTGLSTPEQFRGVIVKLANDHQVTLGEVAQVELGPQDERRDVRYGGKPAIAVGIIKQATANPLDVSKAVRTLLPELNRTLPHGLMAEVGNDDAVFIERSIAAVYHTIGEAIVLVVLVIFFFLRSVRASLVPVVTIPISLITTFALMYAAGFSVNTLTLLAMVLAIGLVVDDAIVVLENIHRHIEEGMERIPAALTGTREIGFAVIAMTLTLAAVYAPVGFATGRAGRLFVEFALTLAGAVLVSGFVALTLTPMMCSKLLRRTESQGLLAKAVERGLAALEGGYRSALRGALSQRWLVVILAALAAGTGGYFFLNLKSELAPLEDRGAIRVRGMGPEGATLAYTSRYSSQASAILAQAPEVRSRLVINGTPEVAAFLVIGRLADWDERARTQQAIAASLSPQIRRIPGVRASIQNPGSFGQRGAALPVAFVVQTSGTYEELEGHVEKMLARIRAYPGLESVDSDLKLNMPEFRIEIDRPKVAALGLDVTTAGRTLETLFGGRQVTRFELNGEQYDVLLQMAARDRASPDALAATTLRSPKGEMIQLSNIVRVIETVAPKELKRFNQLRAAVISANLAPGTSLGEALAFLEGAAREVLPPPVQTDVAGESREFRTSSGGLALIFLLALGFIYLVLAAQFESFRDPVIIMLTVPLSMAGALAALHLAGGTLNVYSQIGLVTLVGLITKHGILIVEFANRRLAAGASRRDAVIEAAGLRLRPILMTTAAMVLGAIPLAVASGAGAESRQAIGWVIVGGMTGGTLLTLFVIPAAYTFLDSFRRPSLAARQPVPAMEASSSFSGG